MSLIRTINAEKLGVKIFKTRASMGKEAARDVSAKLRELLKQKEEVNIIFAAAPSQNEFLETLIQDNAIDWKRINAFHMDEYIGLQADAPQGFGNFLKGRIFDKVGFKSVNYLNGNAESIEEECKRYAQLLKDYPTDIVCMGIGENGHIAFNDPHIAFFNDKNFVKPVELDIKCRNQQVNDGCFASLDKVPTHALTLTIPALMAGKYIYCMVPGKTKEEAVSHTVKGPVVEECPASILKTHDNAVLYVDTDSGKRLL